MRARKPKATAQARLDGDTRRLGPTRLAEKYGAESVTATRGLPDCPEHLKGRGREAWRFLSKELKAMDQDRRPDAMMLEGICSNYQHAVEADLLLAEYGVVVKEPVTSKSGDLLGYRTKKNPALEISNSCWRLVRSFCSEFGISPVCLMRLKAEPKDETEEDLMKILSTPRTPRKPPPVQ